MSVSPSSRAGTVAQSASLRLQLVQLRRENTRLSERVKSLETQSDRLRDHHLRFKELWTGAFEGMVIHDKGMVIDANPAYAKLFGMTVKEMIGSRVYGHLDPKVHGQVRSRIRTNRRYRAQITGRRKDGTLFPMEYYARPIDLNGRTVRIVAVRDISHLVRHQEALAASEERFRNLVEGSIQGILVHRDGKPLFANRALARMVGFSSPEAIVQLRSFKTLVKPGAWGVLRRYDARRVRGLSAPERYEFEGRHKDGHSIWFENSARAVMWDGHPAVQCTWIDITDRKRREEDLQTHRRLLQTVVDTIPHTVFVKDDKGRYRLVNKAMADLWQQPPHVFIGRTALQVGVFPPLLAREFQRWDRKVLTTGQPVEQENVSIPVRSQTRLYNVVRYPVRDRSGRITGLVSVSQNVTERRQAEQALRESELRFRTLVEGSIQGIAVFRGHRPVFANSAFVKIAGFTNTAEVLALSSFAQITHPDDLERLERFLAAMIKGQERDPSIEFRGVRKDGRVIWVNAVVTPVVWNNTPCMLIAMLDITERKHAVERLQQSEERFRNLIEGSIQGTVIHRNYRPLFVNQALADIYGYGSPDEIMKLANLQVLNAPEERDNARRMHLDRLRGKEAPARYELEGLRKDGSRISLECLARVVNWEGEPAVQYTIIDATERKQGEVAVRASQRIMQTVLDSIPLFIFTKDRGGRIVFANRAQCEFDGMSLEQISGLATEEYPNRTPEQIAENLEWDRRVIQEGERVDLPAYTRRDATGRSRWLRGLRLPLRDERGRIVGQLGMNEDITERREAELALRQSEERYRNLVEGSIQGILIQRDFRTLFVNRQFSAMHGYDNPDEILKLGSSFQLLAPEDRPRAAQHYGDYLAGGRAPARMEVRGIRRDGTVFWRENLMREVIWDDGLPAIQVTTQDITDRKTADQQREALMADLRRANADLQTSQRLLQTVFDTIPHALFVKDADGRFLMVNHAQARFWDLEPDQIVGRAAQELPGGLSDHATAVLAEDRRILETGEGVEHAEVRFPNRAGEERWAHLIKLPLRDEAGKAVGIVGLAEDITQRRKAEDALRASQRLLQTVFDTIPLRLTIKNLENRYVLVNRAMAENYGATTDAFTGRRPEELPFLSPEEMSGFVQEDRQVVQTGTPLNIPELQVRIRSGATEVRRLIKMPVFDDQGRVNGILGVIENISDRKAAERQREELLASLRQANDQLAANQRLLRTIFDTIPHRLAVNDEDSRYLMVNFAMAHRYGQREDAFVGHTPRDLDFLPHSERERFLRSILTVQETGAPYEVPEVRSELPDGKEEVIRLLSVPVRDANGRTVGTVSVAEDISERRRADQVREELMAGLRRANDDLRDFAYIVSHDLKAPLRGISSLAEWLAEDYADRLGNEGRENLSLLRARTRRMAALLEGILTYSRIGRLPTAMVPVDTDDIVQQVIDTLNPPPHISFEVDRPLPTVLFDAAQLTQIFQNLIGNAIQHLGKPSGKIRVSAKLDGNFWRFSVSDNGAGIEQRHFDRIFKIFQRVKADQDSGGTGLGLSVVKKIVENQGGSVWVESKPGEGSVFSFTIRDAQG